MTIIPEDVRRTHSNPVTRQLMLLLTLLIILGTAAVTATIVSSRAQSRFATEDERATYDTRVDNRVLLESICAQIEAVSQQINRPDRPVVIEPCPTLSPVPPPAGIAPDE